MSLKGALADRFAVIALAGEMAITYGLLPWTPGSALADCQLLYGEWLSRVGSGNAEDRQILSSVSDFIAKHGDSRFSNVKDQTPDTKVFNRAGYWELIGTEVFAPNGECKLIDTRRLYLLNKPALIEAAQGYGFNRVIKALEGAGALGRRDIGRNTKNHRLPGGGQERLHVVDQEALDMEGGGA